MLILITSLFLRPGVVENSYFGLLTGAGLALYYFPQMANVEFIFTFALLIVLVFILRNSFHLAYLDELTGLQGRRALREQMNKLGSVYSIAMLDVDLFKKFNDRYGHDVGDQALKMVASHISRAGGGSKAYRYGGEEFTLVFSGKSMADVRPCLESLCQSIADAGFILRNKKRPRYISSSNSSGSTQRSVRKSASSNKRVKVTVSIGVRDNQGSGNTPAEVIKSADKALYRAKKKGRNRVSI
jgi:diguanylate cyclase (GGDEF)-like protein